MAYRLEDSPRETRPRSSSTVVASAVATLLVACASGAVESSIEIRAFGGGSAPGAGPGLEFTGFGNAVVNDAGEVAFMGFVTDPDQGIWGTGLFGPGENGAIAAVALDFEPVPGMPAGTEWRFLSSHYPRLDDSGGIAFQAALSGPGIPYPSEASGIWAWSAEQGRVLLARAGDEVSQAGAGVRLGPIPGDSSVPTLDRTGSVGFIANLIDDPSGPIWPTLFEVDSSGGLAIVASRSGPVPGHPGTEFANLYPGSRTELGDWIFPGTYGEPGADPEAHDAGTFLWQPGFDLHELWTYGGPAPGLPAGTNLHGGTVLPADGGSLVFHARLCGPSVDETNDHALYSGDSTGSLLIIAQEGDPAPGTNSGEVFDSFHGSHVAINARGAILFAASLRGPNVSESNDLGIWRYEPDTDDTRLLVRDGDGAPGLSAVSLESVGGPLMNDLDDVVFRASLSGEGVTTGDDEALFAARSGGPASLLLREGDPLPFGPGDERPLSGISILPAYVGDRPGIAQLSDGGHLVLWVHSEGTQAIAVISLPEPSGRGALLLGAGVVSVLRRRRR